MTLPLDALRRRRVDVKWLAAIVASFVVVGFLYPVAAHSQALTAAGFTTSATVATGSVKAGGTVHIAATVTSAAKSTVLVDVEVHDAANNKVYQLSYDNQAFGAGRRRAYRLAWATTTSQAAGVYSVQIGIFQPGWGPLIQWNSAAAQFTIVSRTTTTVGGTTTTVPSTTTTVPSTPVLPPLPAGWPDSLQLGMADPPGDAAALHASAPLDFRYQYLSGGVNTGSGWATWNTNGQFVSYYDAESQAVGMIPVFTYYQLLQSSPGNSQGEPAGDFTNLANIATMTAYYQDLILFFQRAASPSPVVLHVEPDLWAYIEQQAHNNDAATVPAQVASTGLPDLAALPNNAAGFAQAFVTLRNKYAPNVILAYHFSNWGTGTSILYNKPSNATVTALGVQTGQFYLSLGANFDIAFTDLTDRDAAYYQLVNGDGGASWYAAADYARSALYISAFVQTAQKRVVIWQIPLGNTVMLAENNTWDHYQDNKVQWLLDDPTLAHLDAYADAGVVAFLFGRGADGNTCACDASGDGITNPAPIDGNTGVSINADDDGGFFIQMAGAYYQAHPLALP